MDLSGTYTQVSYPVGGVNPSNGYYLEATVGPTKYTILNSYAKLKVGETYVLSFSYRVDSAAAANAANIDFQVQQYDPSGSSVWLKLTTAQIQAAANGWQTATTAPRTFTTCTLEWRFYLYRTSQLTSTVKLMLDNVQFTQTTGNRALTC